jgi:predicted DNA-binding WGR domain protein
LEHDEKKKYYLFRSWGRIGTTIGGSMTDSYGPYLEDAKAQFEKLFLEKSRNEWKDRHAFKKHPLGLNILEIQFETATKSDVKFDIDKSTSSLAKSVKEVIAMIFDIESMNRTMKEFEIDLERMPLGKLSKKQIMSAYGVLTELQNLINSGNAKPVNFLDASNRFYTLLPHSTGMASPPLLNSTDMIKKKSEMLDNLLEIELAYNIIKSENGDQESANRDPFDLHYERLRCGMEVCFLPYFLCVAVSLLMQFSL